MVDEERWSTYKGTCHVILLAKLHDMYLYKTVTFPHQPSLFKVFLRGRTLTQVSLHVNQTLLIYLIYCSWDTNLNKSVDYLLDPFCIYVIHAMFCSVLYFL